MSALNDFDTQTPVILSATRTPIGKLMRALSKLSAPQLGAVVIEEAVKRSKIEPAAVNEVIFGQVVQAGSGQAPARQAAIHGGLPTAIGATTINKVCGSGLKAVMLAASAIRAGDGDVFISGGMESMSTAPYIAPQQRSGRKFGHVELLDTNITDGLWCSFENWMMGEAGEYVADEFDISRAEMDAFALQSHQKAIEAIDAGRFKAEITPVEIKTRKSVLTVDTDEAPRRETSLEALGKLPPAFTQDGKITAGNAPGLNDGAAALAIASAGYAQRLENAIPLARIVSYGQAAVEPQRIFTAPAKAMPIALEKAGWTLDDIDLLEVNEAFAAQVLANGKEMREQGFSWDWDKVNVNGGAIALGHPIGCSGARVLVTLLYALQQRGLKRGMAALCLGGGEAVAMTVELLV